MTSTKTHTINTNYKLRFNNWRIKIYSGDFITQIMNFSLNRMKVEFALPTIVKTFMPKSVTVKKISQYLNTYNY